VIHPNGDVSDIAGSRLPVDHARIAAHRRVAYRRLEHLTAYLQGRVCRHRLILQHFGEDTEGLTCGGCDVCDVAVPSTHTTVVDDTTVRQALSAVARLNGRVGIGKLAGVLHGSRARGVVSIAGATGLTTFGQLAAWREADIIELLRRLLEQGLLSQSAPPYATVSLTRLGIAVMRGDECTSVSDPRAGRGAVETPPASANAAPTQEGTARFEQLRAWRASLARDRRVPAYVVLADRTLTALAADPPHSREELLEVPGIGPVKADLYGPALLALLAQPPGTRDRAG
jgi:ATP-dependent DNA helicase RecQ